MSRKLIMTSDVIRAQIDVCGKMVAYTAEAAHGEVSDQVMWSLNQAIIALQDAFDRCGGEE